MKYDIEWTDGIEESWDRYCAFNPRLEKEK